jgi:hypothetical protein
VDPDGHEDPCGCDVLTPHQAYVIDQTVRFWVATTVTVLQQDAKVISSLFHSSDNGKTAPAPLPANPSDLKGQGYNDTSHPDAASAGHRTFENPETGDKVRFDQGKPGEPGHEGEDHYHRFNPDSTGKGDQYLDKDGKPVPKGSDASHLQPSTQPQQQQPEQTQQPQNPKPD